MTGLKIFSGIVIVVILSFFIASFTTLVSIPGEEKIPTGEKRNQALYVTMHDGVKLAIDIWLPADLKNGQKIPAVINSTRYGRAEEIGPLQRGLYAFGIINLDKEIPEFPIRLFNENQYAYIKVDVRGTGASFGIHESEWSKKEVADYGEIIDWVSKQAWSNGRVGTIGVSYAGNTAELACVSNHPALKVVAPLYDDFDPQYGLIQPGGVINLYIDIWSEMVSMLDNNDVCGLAEAKGLKCFITKMMTPGMKPVDKDKNKALLKAAVKEHTRNANVGENMKSVLFRDDTIGKTNYLMKDISPYGLSDKIEYSHVPMIVWSGWLDAATADGTLSRFLTFTNPQQIVIGPYSHGGHFDTDPFHDPNYPVSPSSDEQVMSIIKQFDSQLKKEKSDSIKSYIRYYTMGENAWRETTVWPPDYVDTVSYYFNKDGVLSRNKPTETTDFDTYNVDFSASTGETNRWFTNLGGDDVVYPDRKEEDKKLLSYTTLPFDTNIEITGSIIVSLQLASTYTDGAVFAYLEDVAPDGRVTYITEGMLRAIHRKISEDPEPYVMLGPNHSFNRKDALPLVPGEISDISLKLYATSVQIKAGHSIRISLAGADKSIFNRYPAEGSPVWKIYRNSNHISKVLFPMRKLNSK